MQLYLNAGGRAEAAVILGNALLAVGMSGHSGAPTAREPSEVVRDFLGAGGTPGLAYALGVTLAAGSVPRGEGGPAGSGALTGHVRGPGVAMAGLTVGLGGPSLEVRSPGTHPPQSLFDVKVLGPGLLEGKQISLILAAAISPATQVQLADGRVMSAREAMREVLSSGWPTHAPTPPAAPSSPISASGPVLSTVGAIERAPTGSYYPFAFVGLPVSGPIWHTNPCVIGPSYLSAATAKAPSS